MRHAGRRQAELDPGERAEQAELVAFADMAAAEDLAGDLAEARAERGVLFPQPDPAAVLYSHLDLFNQHCLNRSFTVRRSVGRQ